MHVYFYAYLRSKHVICMLITAIIILGILIQTIHNNKCYQNKV